MVDEEADEYSSEEGESGNVCKIGKSKFKDVPKNLTAIEFYIFL